MNANLLRPRLAPLFLFCCVLASAVTLHADDRVYLRDHRPGFHRFLGPGRFMHPRMRVVYTHPRYGARPHSIVVRSESAATEISDTAAGSDFQATGPEDQPVVNPGKGPLQHLEIPVNPHGPKIIFIY